MSSNRHFRSVRTASVVAVLVTVAAGVSLVVRPELARLQGTMLTGGLVAWGIARAGWPAVGAAAASVAALLHPWYGLWTPESDTTVVSEVGWLVLAMCMAAATLRPLAYLLLSLGNAVVITGLVTMDTAIAATTQVSLVALLALLTVGGAVVAWQQNRLADEVERREADLRAAELDARARAGAAEAARERLERAHTELMRESRTAVVGELSAAIGHEINSPLTAILMASEDLAQRRPQDPEVHQALALIRDASEQCRSVVGRLLRHSELGDATVRKIDFAEVASEALELTRRHLQQRGAEVETNFTEPIVVFGNEGELRQVVFNLLMHVASREPSRVWMDGGVETAEAWLSVRDDGPPMRAEQQATAFQPLLAGQPSPMIGLALCRTLVRRHGGQIALTSNEQGCAFTVSLPRRTGSARP